MAIGFGALTTNFTGNANTAIGTGALNINRGSGNIALGYLAGSNLTSGDSNIDIGNAGVAGEAGTIRIGTAGTHTAAYITGIAGVTVTGNPVVIDESGHLGTVDISALQGGPPGPQGPQGDPCPVRLTGSGRCNWCHGLHGLARPRRFGWCNGCDW